jgi:hypothetical protein
MHDRNGQPVKKGDRVVLHGTITDAWPGAEVCNVQITIDDPGKVGGCPTITTNSRVAELEPIDGDANA